MAKRIRRTKEQIEASKGLGDTVEKVFKATGIKALVNFIAGEDCRCEERKENLNKFWPYHKISCLVEDEYNFLTDFFIKKTDQITPLEQLELLKIYNRVFNTKHEPTTCSSCWRDYLKQLKQIHEEY